MAYWLMKSEPGVFGIDDLAKAEGKTTHWDGVRNFQARNFMRTMRRGDLAFFYHSSCDEPGVVGIVKIVKEAYPDHTAFAEDDPHFDAGSDPAKPRWYMVDVKLERKFRRTVTLAALREHEQRALKGLTLLKRGNRLSITPVGTAHWKFILDLAE
jgi:predicted RNA-binding protein with PUA-like domain